VVSKKSTTASPTETPTSTVADPEPDATSPPDATEIVTPSATIAQTPTPTAKAATQYFDAVRPITPPPRRHATTTRRTAAEMQSTPFPTMTVTSDVPLEVPAQRPIPSLPPLNTSSEVPMSTATPSSTEQTPTPAPMKTPSPNASDQIADSASYSPEVRKVVDLGLDLVSRNLGYKYVSADPKNGGMDSSGFIFYVLTQAGMKDVPRDAREQYIWVRKAGNFQAVLAQRDDTFELDGLKPGDLLFWASNYGVSKDPDITQTMIYVGREKGTNRRLMIGASEKRSTKGQKKSGVGVFEFKVGQTPPKSNEERPPFFVGYGTPGLSAK